jgi:hypothetical protein
MSRHSWADFSHFTRNEQANGPRAVLGWAFVSWLFWLSRGSRNLCRSGLASESKCRQPSATGITVFGSVILEVALGLVFVYAWFSFACSAIVEFLESIRSQRGKQLAIAIEGMLGAELKARFYRHGLIQSLSKAGRLPSYLPTRSFSRVVLDVLGVPPAQFRQHLETIPGELGTALRALAKDAVSYEHWVLHVEHWFDATMDRCSGWFRRRARWSALACGLVVATLLNVDSIEIASALYSDAHLRLTVVAQADAEQQVPIARRAADKGPTVMAIPIESGTLPLGWENSRFATRADWSENAWRQAGFWFGPVLMKIVGLLVTALTASLGSAFWFDALRRILALRSSFASNAEVMIKGTSSAIASLSGPAQPAAAVAQASALPPGTQATAAASSLTAPAVTSSAGAGVASPNPMMSAVSDASVEIDSIVDIDAGGVRRP